MQAVKLGRSMGVRVGVAYSRNKRVLRTRLRNLNFIVMGVRVGVSNFFLDQSIGIDGNNTFQLKFLTSMKIVGATGLGCLWELEWAWHIRGTNLCCVQGYGI